MHAPAEIRPRASCCRVVPQRPAATSHAAWGIRGATVLATQASFSLAPPSQPASSRRGTILLRTAWIALCPPLRRVARAALPPPFALHFHAHARISIHASGSRSCRQLAGPSPHAAGLPGGGGHDPVGGGVAATRIRPFNRHDVRPHRSGAGAIPSNDSRVWFERSGAGGVRRPRALLHGGHRTAPHAHRHARCAPGHRLGHEPRRYAAGQPHHRDRNKPRGAEARRTAGRVCRRHRPPHRGGRLRAEVSGCGVSRHDSASGSAAAG